MRSTNLKCPFTTVLQAAFTEQLKLTQELKSPYHEAISTPNEKATLTNCGWHEFIFQVLIFPNNTCGDKLNFFLEEQMAYCLPRFASPEKIYSSLQL